MSLRSIIPALALSASTWSLLSAGADDPDVQSGASSDGLFATATKSKTPAPATNQGSAQDPSGPHILLGQAACPGATQVVNASEDAAFCNEEDDQPELTLADIRRAFGELPLPAADLNIQPPDGVTLINFDTNFFTTHTEPITHTVTLLDQQVTLEATPATYTWDFGDGETTRTHKPGAPYPRLVTTHDYARKGDYAVALATTYTGRYRIAGGAWQTIPDTVTIDSTPRPIRAIEAKPKLVGY